VGSGKDCLGAISIISQFFDRIKAGITMIQRSIEVMTNRLSQSTAQRNQYAVQNVLIFIVSELAVTLLESV
jgi:hypothetical protein